mgnify:CR=1 FL=1
MVGIGRAGFGKLTKPAEILLPVKPDKASLSLLPFNLLSSPLFPSTYLHPPPSLPLFWAFHSIMFRNALRQSSRAVTAVSATGRIASVSLAIPTCEHLTPSIAPLSYRNITQWVMLWCLGSLNGLFCRFRASSWSRAVADRFCVSSLGSLGGFRSPQWRLEADPFLRLRGQGFSHRGLIRS